MVKASVKFLFDDKNVREVKSSGKKQDMFYDSGCDGLAIRVTPIRKEPMYVVIVNYMKDGKHGATNRNIGSVGRVPLIKARAIAQNIQKNKAAFLQTKFGQGEGLYDEFKRNGYFPRAKKTESRVGELPLDNGNLISRLEYDKLAQKVIYYRNTLLTIAEGVERFSDRVKKIVNEAMSVRVTK